MTNEFGRFLGTISAKTCLKMDYFDSKSPKIAKCWRLCLQIPLPSAVGGKLPPGPCLG